MLAGEGAGAILLLPIDVEAQVLPSVSTDCWGSGDSSLLSGRGGSSGSPLALCSYYPGWKRQECLYFFPLGLHGHCSREGCPLYEAISDTTPAKGGKSVSLLPNGSASVDSLFGLLWQPPSWEWVGTSLQVGKSDMVWALQLAFAGMRGLIPQFCFVFPWCLSGV